MLGSGLRQFSRDRLTAVGVALLGIAAMAHGVIWLWPGALRCTFYVPCLLVLVLLPVAGLLLAIAGVLRSVWRTGITSKGFVVWGMRALILAVAVSLTRSIITRSWLPNSALAVCLFAACELFLFPFGVFLLAGPILGHLAQVGSRGTRSSAARRVWSQRGPGSVVALVGSALTALTLAVIAFHPLSARLGWGRYGFAPPVPIADLAQVGRVTGLRFPKGTFVMDGEYMGGVAPYLVARIRVPSPDADAFLRRQSLKWAETTTDPASVEVWKSPEVLRMGWDPPSARFALSGFAGGPSGISVVHVVVDLSSGNRGTIYIHWYDTIGKL